MATADLVAFMRARLDEDEQAAREAHAIDPAPWYEDVEYDDRTNQRDGRYGSGLVRADDNVALWDRKQSSALSMTAPTAVHVARHDPARVLDEVDAKRALVNLHSPRQTPGPTMPIGGKWVETTNLDCITCGGEDRLSPSWPCHTIRYLALPYADHPDYREEWRP